MKSITSDYFAFIYCHRPDNRKLSPEASKAGEKRGEREEKREEKMENSFPSRR